MNYEEDDSAICLYIDELKSDDQSLKMNAVEKISLICQHLSQSRICEEFLPYLRYIIQECDNEDEFLVRLSENLTGYLRALGASLPVLRASVQVFETMVIMEDPRVRESSIGGFRFLGHFIFDKVAELILKLGTSELQYGKISCCHLVAALLRDGTFQADMFPHCSKICLLLLEDESMLVKRAAVNAVRFMWVFPADQASPGELTVFSDKFLEQVHQKFRQLQDNGLVYELLSQDFLARFLDLNPPRKRLQIEVDVIEKLLFFLTQPRATPNPLNTSPETTPALDHFWKVKFMICQNLGLLLSDMASFSEAPEVIRKWFVRFPLIRADDKGTAPDSDQQVWTLLARFVYGLYRSFVSVEMVEVRSVFLEQTVRLCRRIPDIRARLCFFSILTDLVNDFVLYDPSFYVKMKVPQFLLLLVDLVIELEIEAFPDLTFSALKFVEQNPVGANEPAQTPAPQEPGEPKKELNEEDKINLINEKIVRDTTTESQPMTAAHLLEHCRALYKCLGLSSNIEIYKRQLEFVHGLRGPSLQSPAVAKLLNEIVQSIGLVPKQNNLKFKEQTLHFLERLIADSRACSDSTYLTRPLLPLEPPKQIKSETHLITLTGRSLSRPLTDKDDTEENQLNVCNIRFALSTMYKGYLVTLSKAPPSRPPAPGDQPEDPRFPRMTPQRARDQLTRKTETRKLDQEFRLEQKQLETIEEILFAFADDTTMMVRNKVIESLMALAHIVSQSYFETIVDRLLKQWTAHKSYMYRISAIHLVALLTLVPKLKNFKSVFDGVVRNGLKEKVVNVKLCLLRLVGLVNQVIPEVTRVSPHLKIMLGFFEGDVDKSVARIAGVIQKTFE